MLTHPGTLHVWGEGDGVCEGKREREKEKGLGKIFYTFWLSGGLLVLLLPGYVRLRDGFSCYWHIVSRDNCYFSEILRNSGELFRDCKSGQKVR